MEPQRVSHKPYKQQIPLTINIVTVLKKKTNIDRIKRSRTLFRITNM